jgi:glycosyltransferase involved in cell wall biosynthesis
MYKIPISIIVPTFNRADLLYFTLKSISLQTVDKSLIEIIVVDDGSVDNTKEVVDRFRSDYSIKYYFQEDDGYRVASARNVGIENSNGEILIFVDSGVVLQSGCIRHHWNTHLFQSSNVVVIGYILGVEEVYDPECRLLKEIDFNYPDKSIEKLLLKRSYLDIRENVFQLCNDNLSMLPAPWTLCWTGNMSIKSEVIRRIGNFDTSFDKRWGVEDIELAFRAHTCGIRFILQREASSIHYPHFSDNKSKQKQEYRNKLHFLKKHPIARSELFLNSSALGFNHAILSTLEK